MSGWRALEIYATFMKVTGELEVVGHERLTDRINRFGDYLQLRRARAEPLSVDHPVISRVEERTTIAKGAVVMVCPVEDLERAGNTRMWREKEVQAVAINTLAFSLVADVHLEPRRGLQDQLERFRGDFLPVTNVSALWVAAAGSETQALQRPFALLNPATILSFSQR
jgi:hypothetical protein